jgi:hypothetical protein
VADFEIASIFGIAGPARHDKTGTALQEATVATKLKWSELTEPEREAQITYIEREQERDNKSGKSGKSYTNLTREDIAKCFECGIFHPTRRAAAAQGTA